MDASIDRMIDPWTGLPAGLLARRPMGRLSRVAALTAEPLNFCQQVLNKTLDTQLTVTRILAAGVNSGRNPPTLVDRFAAQSGSLAQTWSEGQWQIWSAWFATVKQVYPLRTLEREAKDRAEVVQLLCRYGVWEENVRNVVRMQWAWLSLFAHEPPSEESMAREAPPGEKVFAKEPVLP